MALVGHTELGLEEISQRVSVAENPRSQLMYYLSCVSTLLGFDDEPEIHRLTQFHRPNLTEDETFKLLAYCYLLSPDELIDKVIFHNDELCGDSSNNFYELSLAQTHLAVMDSILIGGQRREVRKIMFFKMGWIDECWAEPMKALVEEGKQREEAKEKMKRKQQNSCCVII